MPVDEIYIQVLVDASHADWPLSRKFGCARDNALDLMGLARARVLKPRGQSFHVGAQTRHAAIWKPTQDQIAEIWRVAHDAGFELDLLNIGGGCSAFYAEGIEAPTAYVASVTEQIVQRIGNVAHIMAEPGRGLVAEARTIAADVLLVSCKSETDLHRWVYLNINKCSGLAETMDEAIRYQFKTDHQGDVTGLCIVAARLAIARRFICKEASGPAKRPLCEGPRHCPQLRRLYHLCQRQL